MENSYENSFEKSLEKRKEKHLQLSEEQLGTYKESFVFATSFANLDLNADLAAARASKLSNGKTLRKGRKTRHTRVSRQKPANQGKLKKKSSLLEERDVRRTVGSSSVGRKAKDGVIGEKELKNMLSCFGYDDVTEQEVKSLLKMNDCDLSGEIEFGDYLTMMIEKKETEQLMDDEASIVELKKLFDMFDEDRDGLISVEDLQNLMEAMDEHVSFEECQEMIKYAVKDLKNGLDFKAFRTLMQIEDKEFQE